MPMALMHPATSESRRPLTRVPEGTGFRSMERERRPEIRIFLRHAISR